MPFLVKLVGAAIGAYIIKRVYFTAPTTSTGQVLDAHLDARTAQAVNAALTAIDSSRRNKKRLQGFASSLTAKGYPIAAGLINQYAKTVA